MDRFLITGCPRSGTGYAAEFLNQLGIRCGHEKVYGGSAIASRDWRADWRDYEAESSWFAVPFLPVQDTVVLHQVRHPLRVVRSIVGIGFLRDDYAAPGPAPAFLRQHVPEVFEAEGDVERAVRFWLAWNKRAEPHALLTYRVEDLGVSENNHRPRDESVSWEDIAPMVGAAAVRYGYAAK